MGDKRFEITEEDLPEELGYVHEPITGPVSDYATDWDHTAAEWVNDPYPIWDDLRERCPVAHTPRYGGAWLPVKHEDVARISYDTENFSSRSVVVSNYTPPASAAPRGPVPPISSDPPFHHDARRLLLPAFSPKSVKKIEPATRAFCESLLDKLEGKEVVDAAVDYAQHIPVRVISDMLGLPRSDDELFRQFVHDTLEGVNLDPEERGEAVMPLFTYLLGKVVEHVENPQDDLITYLIEAEMDGEKLDPLHVVGTIVLILIAGIDTTWSAIGSSLWHLAKTPEDRQRIVEDRSLLPTAMEEFLRAYAPVTMARVVAKDHDFNGCPMKENDYLLLSFPAANRDPEMFEDADKVIIDRQVNRHAAFGLGIHRCIGSNLARMELRVALEVWLDRYPEFTLADPDAVTWAAGQVRGPRTIPVRIGF